MVDAARLCDDFLVPRLTVLSFAATKCSKMRRILPLLRRFDGQQLAETGPSLVALRCAFKHLYFNGSFDYWAYDCGFELRLRCHARDILGSWHKV